MKFKSKCKSGSKWKMWPKGKILQPIMTELKDPLVLNLFSVGPLHEFDAIIFLSMSISQWNVFSHNGSLEVLLQQLLLLVFFLPMTIIPNSAS